MYRSHELTRAATAGSIERLLGSGTIADFSALAGFNVTKTFCLPLQP
jgi:hypothetical protein